MNNEPLFFKTLLLKGEAGGTIDRIEKTDTVGLTDIYTIYINDGSTQQIEVTNGSSIASIEYTSSSGNVDTYTVTLTDGSTTTFNVTNGEDYTVPTDGVIYFDGDTVPDGYEETSAPSGSGAYATIDDNTASVSTTYSSSKIEQLISGISGGGVNYSTAEQDTGLKWLDGKTIYQKTYIISTANSAVDVSNLNIDAVVDYKGIVSVNSNGLHRYPLSVYSVNFEGWFEIEGNSMYMWTGGNWASGFIKTDVTIYYTKTTDTI